MKSNFPKIQFFLSLLFFVCSFAVFLFFYRAIYNNQTESQSREAEWQKEAARRDEIKTLDNSVKVIEDERIELETHFAQSSDIVPFLDTIEGLAPKAGATAAVATVDIASDHTGLLVSMKVSGTFNGLYKFLTLLENSPYELQFLGVDMRKQTTPDVKGKTVSAPIWDGVFNIKLLSFIE